MSLLQEIPNVVLEPTLDDDMPRQSIDYDGFLFQGQRRH